ncbi:hypothetical protein [Sphingobacterium siyangense]|uniref:HK97 family phage prohead protease n=1 Tax=Sphingobacterium siyangense TaxID=459529 RepID=A0A562MRI6_9SPHI|nr:hypothetical protein [Sphingobacterium siyangense]TWI22191.1 HK97 family phage prohead protease [Sphingobacterium siyangense]
MPGKTSKKFVLNDERVENSHGFYVLNSGGRFDRFADNPVMLSDHNNENESVLGNWQDLEEQPYVLLAQPNFDTDDTKALEVKRKVDNGFIKGASIGLIPYRFEIIDDKLYLVDWEMVEASIVPVPSNKKSLALYNEQRELMTDEQIKNICLSVRAVVPPTTTTNQHSDMSKIKLSLAALVALGFTDTDKDGVEESMVNEKITALHQQNTLLKTQNDTLTAEREAEKQKTNLAVVDAAIKDGKIEAKSKETFLSLFKTNPELAQSTLDSIPGKTGLAASVTNPSGGAAEVKTLDDFQKLSLADQLNFKATQPDAYNKLFTI